MFKTKAGSVKLQVLVTPDEYRTLRRQAKALGCSVSALARTFLIRDLGFAFDVKDFEDLVASGKYQRRGFARK